MASSNVMTFDRRVEAARRDVSLPTTSPPTTSFQQSASRTPATNKDLPLGGRLGSSADITPFGSYETPSLEDSYFSDALYGCEDFSLDDFNLLDHLDSTSAGETEPSSPESFMARPEVPHTASIASKPSADPVRTTDTSVAALSTSLTVPTIGDIPYENQDVLSDEQFDSLLRDAADAGLFQDSETSNPLSLQPTENPTTTLDTSVTTKRSKGPSDTRSACWTSPLCPNYGKTGADINPSTCGQGCAPFLFSGGPFPESTVADEARLSKHAAASPGVAKDVIDTRRGKKRSESESSQRPLGQISTKSTTDHPTTMNSISSHSSPEQASALSTEDDKSKPCKRQPHNQIEKKYRESLNTQLESLRRVIPSLQTPTIPYDSADIEDLPAPPSKPSKAVILASATAHIKHVERERRRLEEENAALREMVETLRKRIGCEDCEILRFARRLNIGGAAA